MSQSFSYKISETTPTLKSAKHKAIHISRPSDLTSIRNLHKEKKLKELSDFPQDKFTSIQHEWTKYRTTKNTPSKILFKPPKNLQKKNQQNEDIIKLATSTVKLLGRKPNKPRPSAKPSSKLSLLLNSITSELNHLRS